MEYSEIKKIISDLEKSSLAEIAIEFPDGTKISVKNHPEVKATQPVIPEAVVYNDITKAEVNPPKQEVEENAKIIKSPMLGTFYSKPSPDAKAFVEVGQKVKVGETLCIIEAMKLMNEIESEYDGEIAEILVKDGEMVDYGKPLFKIR